MFVVASCIVLTALVYCCCVCSVFFIKLNKVDKADQVVDDYIYDICQTNMKESMTTPRAKENPNLDAIRKHLEKYSGKLSHYEQLHLENPGKLFWFYDIVRKDTSPEPTTDNLEQAESNLEKHTKETKEEHTKIVGPHNTNHQEHIKETKEEHTKIVGPHNTNHQKHNKETEEEHTKIVGPHNTNQAIEKPLLMPKFNEELTSRYAHGKSNDARGGYAPRGAWDARGGYGPHWAVNLHRDSGLQGAYNEQGGSDPQGAYNDQGGSGPYNKFGSKAKRGHGPTGRGKRGNKL